MQSPIDVTFTLCHPSMRLSVEQFLAVPLSDATRKKILYDNAARIFGS